MNPAIRIFVVLIVTVCAASALSACPTCTPSSPSFWDSIVHGATPQGPMDYVIAAVMVVVVLGSGVATVRAILHREQVP
jgi:hypothetical protein